MTKKKEQKTQKDTSNKAKEGLEDNSKIEDLEYTFNHEIDGRKCGMVSMTLGGTQFDSSTNFIGDLQFMEDNKILGNDNYLVFRSHCQGHRFNISHLFLAAF